MSLPATNLAAHHAEHVTLMKKNFLHVHCISFLLRTTDKNPDQTSVTKAEKLILCYSHDKDISDLSMTQKNKIDIILTIQDLEYVIYHIDLSQQLTKEDEQ